MNKPKKFFKSVKPEAVVLPSKLIKFPSISLAIPDISFSGVLVNPLFITTFACVFLFMAIGIVVSDMRVNIVKLEQVRSERIVLEKKVTEWSEIVETYNKYRDGYYQLAILEHSLGNSQKAYEHLQKAMSIDPNFSKALELMEKIAGK